MSLSNGYHTYDRFMQEYEGATVCACDHGCNQWIKEQESRILLGYRMMKISSKNLDKMAQMPIERVDKIWHYTYIQTERRYKILHAKADLRTHYERVVRVGEERVNRVLSFNKNDAKLTAHLLNNGVEQIESDYHDLGTPYVIKSYDIENYKIYMALSDEEKEECIKALEWLNSYLIKGLP